VASQRAVRRSEVPRLESLVLRENGEERLRLGVVLREERELPVAIEPRGGTRHEAAEASAGVVEQHRPPVGRRHGASAR
jgi:hypothetical protein